MSNPASSKQGPYRKPRADIYTVLLIIALVAVLLGCLFAYFETADYTDKPPWSGARTSWLAPAGDWLIFRPETGRKMCLSPSSPRGTIPFSEPSPRKLDQFASTAAFPLSRVI